jgi:AhpD family alkylhydroperoxidase
MNILPATSSDPIGAAALLKHANPVELERFSAFEGAVWDRTTLSPAVIEAVRLHCAKIRGCEFCAAVRYSIATADGLSETQIGHLGTVESRDGFSSEQAAALALVDHFLRDPRKPDEVQAGTIAAALGSQGVMEVLLACCAFSSADLRIALGENRAPNGSGIFDRPRVERLRRSADSSWPVLHGPVLDPDTALPSVAAELTRPVRERLTALWSSTDIPQELTAACIMRSAQLLGVAPDDPVANFLLPEKVTALVDPEDVRNWPAWSVEKGRNEMSLAEQLWIDPAGVTDAITAPLIARHGVDGVIRVAWNLILIGQLQRLALVLHR